MSSTTEPPPPAPFTDGYDEAYGDDGLPRPHYAGLLAALGAHDLRELRADVARRIARAGVSFGEEVFGVDPVPRLLLADEWTRLSAGLVQRVRALDRFVLDAYGPREIVAAGRMPAAAIDGAEGYESELLGRWPEGCTAPIAIAGLDIVRERDGSLHVLEDNLRTPSGYTFAAATQRVVDEALPFEAPPRWQLDEELGPVLARTLRAAAPAGVQEPQVVLLSDGRTSSAWYEHATAARWLDVPVVTLAQLERRGDVLYARLDDGRRVRVDVVYRRCDPDTLRDEQGHPTAVAQALLEPWLAGQLGIANAFGTGVADDKLAHAYVEEMIRFYLGEEPLIPSVPTLDLAAPGALATVLDDLRSYVIKPRMGFGGHGVVICAHAREDDVRKIGERLRREPERWIAQETVAISHHPTVVDGRLEPRHIDLRPFVFASPDEVTVVPGALTRVAWAAGALVVNSSQSGGAKDTWVLRA